MRAILPSAAGLTLAMSLLPCDASGQQKEASLLFAPWEQDSPQQAPAIGTSALLSAVLPGAGQHVLGQNRKWAYLAFETVGWFLYADRRSAGGDLRTQYRDFAWTQARVQQGARVEGDFGYYETLTKWDRSGAYDRDPVVAGLQPENDPAAFNGSIWSRAVLIFPPDPGASLGDPSYDSALEYYQQRAYGTEFLWDWTDTGAQTEYGGLIEESDDRYRQATNVLGVMIANHVVSAVDAFLSARGLPVTTETRVSPFLGAGGGWTASLRVMPR
jgi:hypothetical protein